MHLIVTHAFDTDAACLEVLQTLQLPHLKQLLTRLASKAPSGTGARTFNTTSEHALAQAINIPADDGHQPWAALQARQHTALATLGGPWAFISLCHWQMLSDQIVMRHCPIDDLTPAQSDSLLAAMQPYFQEDGINLYPDLAGRWLARGAMLEGLRCASPERALGRDIGPWMPTGDSAATLRRLQNEMQMLLYTHPLNDERQSQGQPTINSFWIHGCASLPADYAAPMSTAPQVDTQLQSAALSGDWAAWGQAWQMLDATTMKALCQAIDLGQEVTLTLCGERHTQRWHAQKQMAWQRWLANLRGQSVAQTLSQL